MRPQIPIGKTFWSLPDNEKWSIGVLLDSAPVKSLILAISKRSAKAKVELLDSAYWMKGCSSLGKLRYAALVHVSGERRDKLSLIDIKEAVPCPPRRPPIQPPCRPLFRRAGGGGCPRHVAPTSATAWRRRTLSGPARSVVRELMPEYLKLEIEQFSRREALGAARYLAFVIGRDARPPDEPTTSGSPGTADLCHRPSDLDAPPWLWRAVVGLIVKHEGGLPRTLPAAMHC